MRKFIFSTLLALSMLSGSLLGGSLVSAQETAVTGNWTLFYDWGCDGSYSNVPMTINADGTWTMGGGFNYRGPWVQEAGMFMFTFDNSETTYAGNRASGSITGIQTTFTGFTGCFYMLQGGNNRMLVQEQRIGERIVDVAGAVQEGPAGS